MMSLKRNYGWRPDLPDWRDKEFMLAAPVTLPHSTDLRPQCPPVYDQGDLGSCTANAIAAAVDFERQRQKLRFITPSRLFIYFNERVMEHTIASDSGAMIRDGIKSVAKQGVCPEVEWPYDISRFCQRPPMQCYTDALKDRALQYSRISAGLVAMKLCLASGFPFVFGFTVYESFESDEVAKTGIAPMPKPDEAALGGHAVMAVGYDDGMKWFIVRNSWGEKWGMKGYFTLPYAYVADNNLADDRWTIRLVSEQVKASDETGD